MMKFVLYRYAAIATHEPENWYEYARENGSKENVWVYDDPREALLALPDFESRCEKQGDIYKIVVYAIEQEHE